MVRLLSYYWSQNFEIPLLVADSSDLEDAQKLQEVIKRLEKRIVINYRWYETSLPVVNKVSEALKLVETPYVALGADDDFFVPSGLRSAAQFLHTNSSFTVAHGAAVAFKLNEEGAFGAVAETGSYNQRTIGFPTGLERLSDHFTHYSTTWYSVHRSILLRENLQKVADLGLEPSNYVELLASHLSLIQGKAKKLEGLYMVRQVYNRQREYVPDTFDWISNPNWANQYIRFRDCLAGALVQQDGMSMTEAQLVVKELFRAYVARCMKRYIEKHSTPTRLHWRSCGKHIPGARALWRKVRSVIPTDMGDMSLPALLNPASPYHADFMPIYRAIIDTSVFGWCPSLRGDFL